MREIVIKYKVKYNNNKKKAFILSLLKSKGMIKILSGKYLMVRK